LLKLRSKWRVGVINKMTLDEKTKARFLRKSKKKYQIKVVEKEYWLRTYNVEAESKEQAEKMVIEGGNDGSDEGDCYDIESKIKSCEEIN